MIKDFSKQHTQFIESGLKGLPGETVEFILSGKVGSSIVLQHLQDDDTFQTIDDSAFSIERPLNSVSLFTLMSFAQPVKKRITVRFDNQTFKFDCFRGAMYAFISSGSSTWADNMGSGFHSGSSEDINSTKEVFHLLQSLKEEL